MGKLALGTRVRLTKIGMGRYRDDKYNPTIKWGKCMTTTMTTKRVCATE